MICARPWRARRAIRIGLHVRHMDHLALRESRVRIRSVRSGAAARARRTPWRIASSCDVACAATRSRRPLTSPSNVHAAEQVHAALGDRIEHRLGIGRRALITFRISAVAVCRSSASFVSLNRRAFSIAITAWSAQRSDQRELLIAERARRSRRTTVIAPIAAALRDSMAHAAMSPGMPSPARVLRKWRRRSASKSGT